MESAGKTRSSIVACLPCTYKSYVYIYIKVCKVLASDAMTCNDNAIVIPEAFPNNLEGPASGLGTLGIG